MPPEPAQRLDVLAHDLLLAIEDGAAEHSIDLPARRFVSTGNVAWDCPLVAVTLPQITRGTPGQTQSLPNRESASFVAAYELVILRDVPSPAEDGTPPTVARIDASAAELLGDGWLLAVGLAKRLRKIEQTCSAVAQGITFAEGPEGGLAGWRSTVEVGL